MNGIAGFTAPRSFATGAAIGAGDPKSIAVALSAAESMSSAGLSSAQMFGVLVVYSFMTCAGVVTTTIVTVLVLGD